MRRLQIDALDLLTHSALFSHSISKALYALLNEGGLYTANRHTHKQIPASAGDACRRYVQLIYDIHSSWDLLSLPPEGLAKVVGWVRAIKSSLIKEDIDNMKKCDDLLKFVFSYKKFGAGCRPVVERNDKGEVVYGWKSCSDVWSAWHFIEHLNIRVCAYCNAETIFALLLKDKVPGVDVVAAKVASDDEDDSDEADALRKRSALDHFFGYSDYPFLGLSLYNLVPACTRCNSNIKGAKELVYGEYAHPYEVNIDEGFEFSAVYNKKIKYENLKDEDITIVITPRSNVSRNTSNQSLKIAEFFHLYEVYNQQYCGDAADVIRNATLNPKGYRKWLDKKYPMMSTVYKDRMQFGTSLDPARINEHVLSKMTIDIYNQFKQ